MPGFVFQGSLRLPSEVVDGDGDGGGDGGVVVVGVTVAVAVSWGWGFGRGGPKGESVPGWGAAVVFAGGPDLPFGRLAFLSRPV